MAKAWQKSASHRRENANIVTAEILLKADLKAGGNQLLMSANGQCLTAKASIR